MSQKSQSIKKKKPSRPVFQWTFQNLVFIVVVIIFTVSVIWSEPISHLFTGINIQDINLVASPTTLPGTPTPLPAEYLSNAEQTNGILLGVMILGVIIIAGTIGVLIRDRS